MALPTSKYYFFYPLLFLLLAITIANGDPTKHLRVYFHEFTGVTTVLVAGLHNNASTFGNVNVFDSALTETPEFTPDRIIGRGQGISVYDSLGVTAILGAINFVFSAGEYNGSSLAMLGMSTASLAVNDHPIVGGTGRFRLASGYALSQLLTYNETYVLLQWDFYVL